jgi:hypothetical protein
MSGLSNFDFELFVFGVSTSFNELLELFEFVFGLELFGLELFEFGVSTSFNELLELFELIPGESPSSTSQVISGERAGVMKPTDDIGELHTHRPFFLVINTRTATDTM